MAVVADFTVQTEYLVGRPREVRVIVYSTLSSLRAACTRYENAFRSPKNRKRGEYSELLGICHRWHIGAVNDRQPGSIVRLSKTHLGIGVVSHELTHAAVNIAMYDGDGSPLTDENDEQFAWVLGELVRQTAAEFYARGLYLL